MQISIHDILQWKSFIFYLRDIFLCHFLFRPLFLLLLLSASSLSPSSSSSSPSSIPSTSSLPPSLSSQSLPPLLLPALPLPPFSSSTGPLLLWSSSHVVQLESAGVSPICFVFSTLRHCCQTSFCPFIRIACPDNHSHRR